MKFALPSDEHHPYQDDRAIEVAMKIVSDFDPDLIMTGSDGMDFYQFSRFNQNPARMKIGFKEELDSWKRTQKMWIDAAPNAERFYIKGNHEDRLRKYIWKNAQLYGVEALELPMLLGFDELHIPYVSVYEDFYEKVIDNVVSIKHGQFARKFSAYSAKAEMENEKHSISTITFHTHRGGSFWSRTRHGIIQAHEGFCLCLMEPEYVHHPDWQQGIVVGEVVNGMLSVEPVLIVDYAGQKRAIWRGKEYTA